MAEEFPPAALRSVRVLVVEDEPLVALLLEDMLSEIGCVVAASAASVAQAIAELHATTSIDVAVLDVKLGEELVFPVANVLAASGIPFVFSTGYCPPDLAERYPNCPLLRKPYGPKALAGALTAIVPPPPQPGRLAA